MRLLAVFVLFWVCVCGGACAQDGGVGGPKLISRSEPVYPPIAKAAHISGDVKLELNINASGHVTGGKVLSGPAMLAGAAQDCVRNWVYEATGRDGARVNATVSFVLPGPINPDDGKIGEEFFPVSRQCIDAVIGNIDIAKQAEVCLQAARIAEKFSTQERFIERRSAYVYASTALLRNKQLK
jgi:TonB family protein